MSAASRRLLRPGLLGGALLVGIALTSLATDFHYREDPGRTPAGVNYRFAKPIKSYDRGNSGSVRLALFGDWGMNTTVHSLVADGLHAFQKKGKAADRGLHAVIMAGDNFYTKGVKGLDDPKWEKLWGKQFRRVNVPFFVALGNHDYGYGPECAQVQVKKTGTQGFENWVCKDLNGPGNPGIFWERWLQTDDFDLQLVFIDTNLLLVSKMRLFRKWPEHMQWLWERLDADPPARPVKAKGKPTVVRLVVGHHVPVCFGEKEYEVTFINAKANKVGPGRRSLTDILRERATAYLCGHAHTIQFNNLDGKTVRPQKGPVHGKIRRLRKQVPLQIISGTGGECRQTSYWGDPCYYVARLPGFTSIVLDRKKGKATLTASFVDCRHRGLPRPIFGLRMPVDSTNARAAEAKEKGEKTPSRPRRRAYSRDPEETGDKTDGEPTDREKPGETSGKTSGEGDSDRE